MNYKTLAQIYINLGSYKKHLFKIFNVIKLVLIGVLLGDIFGENKCFSQISLGYLILTDLFFIALIL